MSVSPSVQPLGNSEDERQGGSPYFPRISGANTVARPSPIPSATDEAFPTVKLQAKMVKQTPLPYQTQEFRPCIVLKKFEPSVRVSDSFVPGIQADEVLGEFKKKRTVILHTDRYTQHGQLKLEADSQKVRLAQEGQMLQDVRSRMRLREALAHRARHDLHLGGSPLAAADDAKTFQDVANEPPAHRSKKPHRRRRRRDRDQLQQQSSTKQQPMKLGFIPEESVESGHRRYGGGQLTSHSSAPSIPTASLLHLHPPLVGGGQTFASRSEFDALAALIGAESSAMGPELQGGSGLEKVKLDGSKAVFNRRSDILAEIARLKAIVLPDFAKDLYIGRGIRLPESHALNNPKKTLGSDDPILEALLHRAQQPSRIIDEAGNILIASSGVSGSQQQRQQPLRQVFAADVIAKPGAASENQPKTNNSVDQSQQQLQQLGSLEEEPNRQQEQTESTAESAIAQDEPAAQLPEPFSGLPDEWMRSSEVPASAHKEGDEASVQEQINRLDLPPGVTSYLLAILAASTHTGAGKLTLELGRLIGQRLIATPGLLDSSRGLIGWLRRGLDLFHDVDREVRGSVSLPAFLDILSSMRGMPLDNEEITRLQGSFGLSGDSVSKLAFLTVLPFLQDLLDRKA